MTAGGLPSSDAEPLAGCGLGLDPLFFWDLAHSKHTLRMPAPVLGVAIRSRSAPRHMLHGHVRRSD